MANREWDQGKDWGYDAGSSRGTVRRREDEEDYHRSAGEWQGGKKPRYDTGKQAIPYEGYYGQQQQTNQEGQQQYQEDTYSHDDRYQKTQRRRLVPSEPSQHVIFLGLDPDFTESDLHTFLMSFGTALDSVTIIRDRSTGLSKGFGFAQFSSTEHARVFVTPNFPFISVPPPASHGASAAQAYVAAIASGAPQHPGRRVKIDFSQSAHPPDGGRYRGAGGPSFGKPSNDGTRDIGNVQSPVVLLRGLDPLTTLEIIAESLRTSEGSSKEGAKGMKRIILIKDKNTAMGLGFAFAEFIDVQSSSSLLAAVMSVQLHPNGFRVSDRPIAVCFANPAAFQPLQPYMLRDEACIVGSTNLGGVEGVFAKYWDEGTSVSELSFEVAEPQKKETKEKKKKTKAAEAEATAFLNAIAAETKPAVAGPSTLPIQAKPLSLSLNKGATTSKTAGGPAMKPSLGFAIGEDPNAPNTPEHEVGMNKTADRLNAYRKVPPLIASKKVASSINRWNMMQEELHAPEAVVAPVAVTPSPVIAQAVSVPAPSPAPIIAPGEPNNTEQEQVGEFEFGDPQGHTCFLCARQFKSAEQLRRHDKESTLHKKNLQNESLRDIAREKAANARANPAAPVGDGTPANNYRDRALERRALHGQPDVPPPEKKPHHQTQRKKKISALPPGRAVDPSPPPPPASVEPAKDENNIGNKLLKKMGWSEGTGLGAEGEGRIDPVQTALYAQGAGLGASKGKEVGKYAPGYSGYVDMARDAARERYGE